ncbi:MAG: FliG C-terminal domain-containing protein [Planctomycetota bacterium]
MNRASSLTQAAIVLSSLPKKHAAMILSRLNPTDIKTLLQAIMRLDKDAARGINSALKRFRKDTARWSVATASLEEVQAQVEAALDTPPSEFEIKSESEQPFDFLIETHAAIRTHLLSEEHPRNIAVVLSMLPPQMASETLGDLEEVLKVSVLRRLCEIEEIREEEVTDLSFALKLRLKKILASWYSKSKGINLAAELLTCADESTQEKILEIMNQSDPDLAKRLRRSVISIEDLTKYSGSDIRILLKHVDTAVWAPALKNCDSELQQFIMAHMGQQPTEILQFEIENLGYVSDKAQDQARQCILKELLRLSRDGKLSGKPKKQNKAKPVGFPKTLDASRSSYSMVSSIN